MATWDVRLICTAAVDVLVGNDQNKNAKLGCSQLDRIRHDEHQLAKEKSTMPRNKRLLDRLGYYEDARDASRPSNSSNETVAHRSSRLYSHGKG